MAKKPMLNREDVKENASYEIDGETWFLHVILRPGNGESVRLFDMPRNDEYYELERQGKVKRLYMQMNKFLRKAKLKT